MKKSPLIRRPQPRRTLSSSLRQYRTTPLEEETPFTSSGHYGTSSSSHSREIRSARQVTEPTEHDRLLQQVSETTEDHLDADHTISYNDDDDDDDDPEAAFGDAQADDDGLFPPNCTWTGEGEMPARADPFRISKCAVWERIHEIRIIIMDCIDDPYSLEQLKAPRMNISVVRPLVDKLYNLQDLCIVYCLLINRIQFIRQQAYATHHQTVNLTRALLCELLAEKILRRYNENNPGPLGLLKLANILVAGFDPFQNAPPEVIRDGSRSGHGLFSRQGVSHEQRISALEAAIVSESKSFLASSGCQKVVDAIYRGRIVYSPNSFMDIIPDYWKRRPISLYDPRRAPLLNQYRLRVPRTRNVIEVVQFIMLLVLYILVMVSREDWRTTKYDLLEAFFDLYAIGWIIDQIASMIEHGWGVYTQNLWSFLDVIFSLQFSTYFALRMHGLIVDHPSDPAYQLYGRTALDILSCAAPFLVPRLAFNLMSDNMLFLSLRAMMGDFLTLTGLAIWCFAGFFLSLIWLHDGIYQPETIGKWMIWIWFGLDGTGIDEAPDFHWFLGPALMISFAFLGNTLFLTVLVSMLSNTFSLITSNAVQEIQYRRSVLTFMGVKSDAIFAYTPPFNIPALLFLLPLKFLISPRNFHKINVGLVRVLNAPLLVLLSLYERHTLWLPRHRQHYRSRKIDWKDANGPRMTNTSWISSILFWDFSKFSILGSVQAVFETEPSRAWFEDVNRNGITAPLVVIQEPDMETSNNVPFASPKADVARTMDGSTGDQNRPQKNLGIGTGRRKASVARPSNDGAEHSLALKRWMSGERRRDSVTDYEHSEANLQEMNTRLSNLEQSMERLESLIEQFLDGSGENESQTQEQLRVDARAEGV